MESVATSPLSPEAILIAARDHGVTLRRRTWYRAAERAGCAAAVAAIGVDPRLKYRDFGVGAIQVALDRSGLGRLEIVGVIDGFEGSPRSRHFAGDPGYRSGHAAGLAVAWAVGLEIGRVA